MTVTQKREGIGGFISASELLGLKAASVCLFLVAMLVQPSYLPAQSTLSTIRGAVTDPSGALVPGAEIPLIDTETNVSGMVTSDASDNFEIPNLKPGTYRVQMQMT